MCAQEFLFSCGWCGEKTEEEYDIPLRSTTYLRASKPSEIVKGSGEIPMGPVGYHQHSERHQAQSATRAKKAKRMKPPTRMVKTAAAKKSS